MNKREVKKFIRTFDPERVYEFGTLNGNEYIHVYERSCSKDGKESGAVWHYTIKGMGDMLFAKGIYIDGVKYQPVKMFPNRRTDIWLPDFGIFTAPDKDSEEKSKPIPESWARNYWGGYMAGQLKVGDKIVKFLLEPHDNMTIMNPWACASGKYGGVNKRPGWLLFILNDNIKTRQDFKKELKKINEEV